MIDPFVFECDDLPAGTQVLAFHGREEISRPYEFEIYLRIPHEESLHFDFEALSRKRATLVVRYADGSPRASYHGVVASIELLYELTTEAMYKVVLVPRFWLAGLNRHSRVFVEQTLTEILDEVLHANGFAASDYVIALDGPHAAMEHVCQYRESDLDFLSRRMEREGVYYFFTQDDAGEKLVITDASANAPRLPVSPVDFFAAADGTGAEAMQAFRAKKTTVSSAVRLDDYSYMSPGMALMREESVPGAQGGVIRGFAEASRTDDAQKYSDDVTRLAKLRAEEVRARELTRWGRGRVYELRPGHAWTLAQHPRPAMNTEYLTVSVIHRGNAGIASPEMQSLLRAENVSDESYSAEVTAIPHAITFRPELRTPVPRIYSVESATVDGPYGTGHPYAQLDDQGRYLVRVRFDENQRPDGKASARVRMLQPYGGDPEGMHFPLRRGTEVMLVFLGGDPDRPVIAGVAPTANTASPVSAHNATKNVLISGAQNKLVMEDLTAQAYVHLSTPYKNTYLHMGSVEGGTLAGMEAMLPQLVVHTDGNRRDDTQGNVGVEIGGDRDTHVGGTSTETIDGDREIQITQNTKSLTIQNSEAMNVGNCSTLNVSNNMSVTLGLTGSTYVGARDSLTVGLTRETMVGGASEITVGASDTTFVGPKAERNLAAVQTTTVGLTNDVFVGAKQELNVSDTQSVTVGNATDIYVGNKMDVFAGTSLGLYAGVPIDMKLAAATDLFVGGKIEVVLALALELVVAAKVDIFVGAKVEVCENAHVETKPMVINEYEMLVNKGDGCMMDFSFFMVTGKMITVG